MWDYTDIVKSFYTAPKNAGIMEDADIVAEVGSIVCGDALKLYLKLDENSVITDAKFQVFGCGSAIASSSALTELLIGKTMEEAEKITNRQIADFLGGLPPEKMHCSVMGKEAVDKAVSIWRGTDVSDDNDIDGTLICQCFSVTDTLIRRVIRANRLSSVEEVTNFTKAAGACGACIHKIQDIIEEELAARRLADSIGQGK